VVAFHEFQVAPRWAPLGRAVISTTKPGEGTNDGYCHPRAVTVETLTKAMGAPGRAR
jgi:hypothetical protein